MLFIRVFGPLRLVGDEERRWTDENIDMVALKHFPNIDKEKGLSRPILYSNWLSKVNPLQTDPVGIVAASEAQIQVTNSLI